MKTLITGSNGFIGKNLVNLLSGFNDYEILKFNKSDKISDIDLSNIDVIFHLASVHRPLDKSEFKIYNIDFTRDLLEWCKRFNPAPIVIYTSSVQSSQNTDYGLSKKECEGMICEYQKYNELSKYFRLTNTFGEHGKPNYLSVVATFCYNISHNLPVKINDRNTKLKLTYVGDVVNALHEHSINRKVEKEPLSVTPYYEYTLGELSDSIYGIKEGIVSDNELSRKLKVTYDYYSSLP